MKKILLFIVLALSLVACKKEYKIYSFAQLDQCLAPTQVQVKVKYMDVTFDWKVFPDAEHYYFEIYDTELEEGQEPDPSTMVDHFEITPEKLPYTYRGPEDMRCYYRVKATCTGRKDSRWFSGTFKTDTDPTVTCSRPSSLLASTYGDMVVFSWDTYPNTEYYELEIYSKYVGADAESDPENIVQKVDIQPTEVPYSIKLDPDLKYYYRVRAVAPTAGLKPSKWLTGSFSTVEFVWPVDDSALNTYTTQNYKGTCDDGTPSPFEGGGGPNNEKVGEVDLNKFHYGVKCTCWGNRIAFAPGNAECVINDYGAPVPIKNYFSFKICKPGTIETYLTSTAGGEACFVVLANRGDEGPKASIIYKSKDLHTDYYSSGKTKDKIVIPESALYGIKEAATVYVFASNYLNVQVLQITWTPAS